MKNYLFAATASLLIILASCTPAQTTNTDGTSESVSNELVGKWTFTDARTIQWAGDKTITDKRTGTFSISMPDKKHVVFSGDVDTDGSVIYSLPGVASLSLNTVTHKDDDRDDVCTYVAAAWGNGILRIPYTIRGEWKKDGVMTKIRVSGNIEAVKK